MTSEIAETLTALKFGLSGVLLISKVLENHQKSLKALREVVAVAWQGPFSPSTNSPTLEFC